MSQQADGLQPSDWQAEEEGHGMQYKLHDKVNNHVFISSKSNSIVNTTHNSFIDDELVTWLQYPLDDDACPDIFQHWPLPCASPASATSTDGFTLPSSALKDDPPLQEKNEALTIDNIASKRLPTACEGGIPIDTDQGTTAPSMKVSHQEASTTQAVLKQRVGGAQQDNPLFRHGNEAAPTATLQQGSGHGESVAKDCRKLAHLKLSSHEDVRSWAAKEPHLATNVSTESKRLIAEKTVVADTGLDNRRAHTAQFKHSTQDEREQGLGKMANTHLKFQPHYSIEGSSSGHKLQKEASESPMEKDLSRKLSVIPDSAQAVNAKASPSAEAALALGAGRAAGVIRASGTEAFSKVRTSLQSIRPSLSAYTLSPASASGNCSSYPAGCSSPMLPPRGRAFGFHDVTFSTQPAQQNGASRKLKNTAQPHVFRPWLSMHSIGSQEHHLMNPLNGDSNNNDHSSKDSPLESSTTALLGSQGTEELSVMFKQVHNAEQAKESANVGGGSRAVAFYGMDTCDMQKLSGLSMAFREKREDFAFSGGSETSESLKETISGSKRILEDSECQSEDAEAESPVNSQARSSGSKRTRANEVHNLSERRRRNRINDKMNALRDLIPNATKSNKAALLDEAIDYLKNLQLQLQVMSLRTGMTLSPMVVPPGLPHMHTPQASPFHPMGIGTAGGSSLAGGGSTVSVAMCDITYGVPARPLGSMTSSEPRMLQPSESSSNNQLQASTVPQSIPLNFPHSFVQAPSQSIFSVHMDMYNTYLQQQQLQQQHLQQHLQHQEQLVSPQVQAPSLPPPSSQQQSHYQHQA